MTDKRLRCVASMVRQNARLADIGTDHAHLPVYLLQENRIVRAIAADIGEGPADAARRTVGAAGLADKVAVRVGDGLSVISPEEVTDIVIAGMGGETIIHILSEARWLKKGDYRLVLQPMSKTVELREWLFENGFVIEEEHLVKDGHHLYCVMAVGIGKTENHLPLEAYVGVLSFEEGKPYFEQQLRYLQQRAKGAACGGNEEQHKYYSSLVDQLQHFIESGGERL